MPLPHIKAKPAKVPPRPAGLPGAIPSASSLSRRVDAAGVERPVLGIMLIGGALVGSQVRDIRLANELAERGYPVHVWWAVDRAKQALLDPRIQQHWLFNLSRYCKYGERNLNEWLGRAVSWLTNDMTRALGAQNSPRLTRRLMRQMLANVCSGVEYDQSLIRRFARELTAAGVTHLMPTLEFLAPYAAAARELVPHKLRYLVTFQGYELYANYVRDIGLESALYGRLHRAVELSDWPAIAVSDAYAERICHDIGLSKDLLRTIPPGIPTPPSIELERAQKLVAQALPGYDANRPLVSYLGRQDSEKGIDLLLYAMRILQQRQIDMQLAICGPTAFGTSYGAACRAIADNLRCHVLWSGYINDDLRSALFRASRCVVYPSIHEEPFGMVPVEAMMHGTPVVIPDNGGIATVATLGGEQSGLNFRSWDSAHLAEQIQRLLGDDALHAKFSTAARGVASQFSMQKLGDRVLEHIGLPPYPEDAPLPDRHEPAVAAHAHRVA